MISPSVLIGSVRRVSKTMIVMLASLASASGAAWLWWTFMTEFMWRLFHFEADSREQWNRLGDALIAGQPIWFGSRLGTARVDLLWVAAWLVGPVLGLVWVRLAWTRGTRLALWAWSLVSSGQMLSGRRWLMSKPGKARMTQPSFLSRSPIPQPITMAPAGEGVSAVFRADGTLVVPGSSQGDDRVVGPGPEPVKGNRAGGPEAMGQDEMEEILGSIAAMKAAKAKTLLEHQGGYAQEGEASSTQAYAGQAYADADSVVDLLKEDLGKRLGEGGGGGGPSREQQELPAVVEEPEGDREAEPGEDDGDEGEGGNETDVGLPFLAQRELSQKSRSVIAATVGWLRAAQWQIVGELQLEMRELGRLGRAVIQVVAISPDGHHLFVGSVPGFGGETWFPDEFGESNGVPLWFAASAASKGRAELEGREPEVDTIIPSPVLTLAAARKYLQGVLADDGVIAAAVLVDPEDLLDDDDDAASRAATFRAELEVSVACDEESLNTLLAPLEPDGRQGTSALQRQGRIAQLLKAHQV